MFKLFARVLVPLLALGFLGTAACTEPPTHDRPKLVVLGFDGMDPDLMDRWMNEGQLPNISLLAKQGGFRALETTHSPESPTAWASFATGVNPGKHNIYDFLVRDTNTYLPDIGMVARQPGRFLFNFVPIAKPRVQSTRGGTSFWITAGEAGVRSAVLTVPVTFPPEDVPSGKMLSGLPQPDIRGTMGTFSYFATDLSRFEEGNTEMGGILRRLIVEGNVARSELVGPPNPIITARIDAIRKKGTSINQADRERLAELEAHADVSDHGFHSWRKAVNLNTWLIQNRYMALRGQSLNDGKLSDLLGSGTFWENVDWARTRAYAMGLGQIYFNLRGREGRGSVNPGAEAKDLGDELSTRLLSMTDPDDGSRIVRAVYKRDDIYSGEYLNNAPDLQVGMEEGYRVSWQTTLGGSPQGIVYPNMKKWSGDHGGYDFTTTAGVLISSRPLSGSTASIVDIAPTVLKFFDVTIPGYIDGKPLF
jgi:predicted AlkP superfamily phosphohydrolase/phosphomutase